MALHQKKIQNEGDTPFFRDLEDDTSPPKKRGKHDSDFDSSEQKPDLDFYLPKQKPERECEWRRLFQFRFYRSESLEVFKDITKCEEDIKALEQAHDKAKDFFLAEIEVLKQKQPSPITLKVLETILGKQKGAYGNICEADEMLKFVKADVDTYIKYRDDILLKHHLEWESYFDSVKQLAEKPGVDKMIKFLFCGVGNLERIENYSGLTPLDMSAFHGILKMKNQINFDIEEYNEDEEQFGMLKMTEVLEANEGPLSNIRSLREAYKTTDAYVKKQSLLYEIDTCGHMFRLAQCLRSAVSRLGIMRQQMKLLYDKNVIEKGYYKLFFHDWYRCPFMGDD